ncbi:5-carboxymethyl-2-hydroxymuconate Delta-isomerase [Streptantibioticus cattleyicolor]|uniref:Isomerase n=1 Tax=Streptantibioticus cattleyicolor (strain ATCC 35852 / DSM 46488 / JCM 4925 / NBRC 14057 / NRRL 8057) TaxID=1003195 RepID=F8JM78_STREN|nr:isomerase [Streptantibioticus cattleyicolor]AEW99390.1 isomerase [Streptantibioticus cattleyicolor NRRL 8057 = DSM 46488]CCB71568.1 putative isomerase [Streptantibioticus cattleyicolor NRRL 8057 = DSM 46488]
MPQISVDHSADLAFDRRGFALAAHAVAAEIIGCRVEDCKTRFRTVAETVVADGGGEHAVVVGEMRIMPGRTQQAKAALSEALVAKLAEYVKPEPGRRVHLAWTVLDQTPETYRRAELRG